MIQGWAEQSARLQLVNQGAKKQTSLFLFNFLEMEI